MVRSMLAVASTQCGAGTKSAALTGARWWCSSHLTLGGPVNPNLCSHTRISNDSGPPLLHEKRQSHSGTYRSPVCGVKLRACTCATSEGLRHAISSACTSQNEMYPSWLETASSACGAGTHRCRARAAVVASARAAAAAASPPLASPPPRARPAEALRALGADARTRRRQQLVRELRHAAPAAPRRCR